MNTELGIVLDAVRRAGSRVMQLAKDGFEIHRKADDSPVTTADLAVNDILKETLLEHFPHDGWMSEENPDTSERLKKSRVWVIDPIDGTSYFIKGIPQFSISVALVEDHVPVLGIVYNPATQELYTAEKGKGLYLNGDRIEVDSIPAAGLTILVNPSRMERQDFTAYEDRCTLKPMGSIAYSLALVAAGQADGTINNDRLHEWDIAAGWLLVQEGQGTSTDFEGNPFRYNQADPEVYGILAARSGAQSEFEAVLTP